MVWVLQLMEQLEWLCKEDEQRHDPQDEQTDATAEVSCGVTLAGFACHVAGELRILLVELALDLLEDLLFVFRKWHTVVAHPPGRASAKLLHRALVRLRVQLSSQS